MKTILLTLSFVITAGLLFGQNNQYPFDPMARVIPPSPNAAALFKYVEIPVYKNTGIPNISIPMGEAQSGSLSLPIILNYHAGGIKVEEMASWVGLGWSLETGGMISRTVLGIQDEHYPYGYFNCVPENAANYKERVTTGKADAEPDVFYFNFGNQSGKFVFDRDGGVHVVPYQDIKIEAPTNFKGTNATDQWIITDQNGVKYYFGKSRDGRTAVESTQLLSTTCGYDAPGAIDQFEPFKSTWHLMEIVSPQNDEISIYYGEAVTMNMDPQKSETIFKQPPFIFTGICTAAGENFFGPDGLPNGLAMDITGVALDDYMAYYVAEYPSLTCGMALNAMPSNYNCTSQTSILTYRASEIRSDKLRIRFTTSTRSDCGDLKLDRIAFYDKTNQTLLGQYDFTYTYFQSGNGNAQINKRLKLDALTEKGDNGDAKPPYVFDYYHQVQLPPRDSKAQDHWGFYNGEDNNGSLIPYDAFVGIPALNESDVQCMADRNTYPYYSKAGILTKIVYPTGGYSEFEFESNEYGKRVLNDGIAYPVYQYQEIPQSVSVQSINGLPQTSVSQSFTINTHGPVWVNLDFDLIGHAGLDPTSAEIILKKPDGTLLVVMDDLWGVGDPNPNPHPNQTFSPCRHLLFPGDYVLEINTYSDGTASAYIEARASVEWVDLGAVLSGGYYTGGLRCKKMTTYDGQDHNKDMIKKYEYTLDDGRCSGILYSKPIYVHQFDQITGQAPSFIYEKILSASNQSKAPLLLGNGIQVEYARVKEIWGNNGENGSMAETFTSCEDYPDLGDFHFFPFPPPTSFAHKRGKLKQTFIYKANGTILSEETHNYSVVKSVPPHLVNKAYTAIKNYANGNDVVLTKPYLYYSEWFDQISSTKTSYDNNGNTLTTTQRFYYDNFPSGPLVPVRVETENSDGNTHVQSTKFVTQYSVDPNANNSQEVLAIKSLQDRHVHSIPIESYNSLTKPGQSNLILGGTYTEFKNWTAQLTMPSKVWQIETLQPFGNFVPTYIANGALVKNQNYKGQGVFDAYDATGNLLQAHRPNNLPMTTIWGYDAELPVAKVINASAQQAAFTSFEHPGDGSQAENGNWTVSATATYWNSSDPKTGKYVFSLSPTATLVSYQIQVTGDYKLSIWHKGDVVMTVFDGQNNLQTFTFSAVGTGWEYSTKSFNVSQNQYVILKTVTQAATIDELRLLPTNAAMTTVSYDPNNRQPLTIVNENAQSASFLYDNFQRLKAKKDQDGVILETYNYQYWNNNGAKNMVEVKTALTEQETSLSAFKDFDPLNGDGVALNLGYQDGLGRPYEALAVGATPDLGDIVTFMDYDPFGRFQKSYLPYSAKSNAGAFIPAPVTDQKDFYNDLYGPEGDFSFQETVFEPSPLNRTLEQGEAGSDGAVGNGHTSKMAYRFNNYGDVPLFYNYFYIGYFPANTLHVNEATATNGFKTLTFTDKLGRTLLTKSEISAGVWATTLMLYDDFGRISIVVPPIAYNLLMANGFDMNLAAIQNIIFKYSYDARWRQIEKKVPDAESVEMVYDKLDRPVLTRDGNQRDAAEWTYNKYDEFGRLVVTGTVPSAGLAADRPTAQAAADAATILYESRSASGSTGYTQNAYPAVTGTPLKIFFYDDYDYDRNGANDPDNQFSPEPTITALTPADYIYGKQTGSKVRILGTNNWLKTITFYDQYGRTLQTQGGNHLGGMDVSTNGYDYPASHLTATKRKHTAQGQPTMTIEETYTYDHVGRPTQLWHTVNGGTPILIAYTVYDQLGRAMEKNLHSKDFDPQTLEGKFLQSIDYSLDIRSRLTGINNPFDMCENVDGGSGDNAWPDLEAANPGFLFGDRPSTKLTEDDHCDLFAEAIGYRTDGNIGNVYWRAADRPEVPVYSFAYDGLNRLKESQYDEFRADGTGTFGVVATYTDRYNEIAEYDPNGNITSLQRTGLLAGGGFGAIDFLLYTYTGNQLVSVYDAAQYASGTTKGFKDNLLASADYTYDANGNLTRDENKLMTITYNLLNLPTQALFDNGSSITWLYDAAGVKLRKTVHKPNQSDLIKDYVGGIEYYNGALEAIYTAEGRCVPQNSSYRYEYALKDHLGSGRLYFSDLNGDGKIKGTLDPNDANYDPANDEILQEAHTYPFGMAMEGAWDDVTGSANRYQFTGKELNLELDLGWIDFGARWYEPALGRWGAVDPLTEKYASWSGYNYVMGNPVGMVDPDGLRVINGHEEEYRKAEKDRDDAKVSYETLQSNKLDKKDEGYDEYKDKLKAAKNALSVASSIYTKAKENYDKVESLLNEYAYYDEASYNTLNTLRDPYGVDVDVYFGIDESMKGGDVKFGELSNKGDHGLTVARANVILNGETPVNYSIYSERGANTVNVTLSYFASVVTVAHEVGHVFYLVGRALEYRNWKKTNPENYIIGGHGPNDPNGKASDDAETNFKRLQQNKTSSIPENFHRN